MGIAESAVNILKFNVSISGSGFGHLRVGQFVDFFFRLIFIEVLQLFHQSVKELGVIFFNKALDTGGIHDIDFSGVDA